MTTKRIAVFALAVLCALSTTAAQGLLRSGSRGAGSGSAAGGAGGYTVATVPNVQLADARRFTSNPDGILSEATVAEIDRMCYDLKQRHMAQVVVLVLDRVDDSALDMFAHNVLNRWGVGEKGRDNGLVISVVRSQRDVQFETGYGLEGVLPDALCKRIQTVYMNPSLAAGNFDKGVLDGVKAVYNVLTDNKEELGALDAAAEGEGAASPLSNVLSLLFGLVFFIVIVALTSRRGRGGGDGPDGMGGAGGSRGSRGGLGGNMGSFLAGMLLGGMGGRGGGFGGGGFGGGGSFGGGFGGGRSGGGGARSGF